MVYRIQFIHENMGEKKVIKEYHNADVHVPKIDELVVINNIKYYAFIVNSFYNYDTNEQDVEVTLKYFMSI